MRLLNKNSKRFIVNLFSDFILSKMDKNENSIIQVSDCNNFVVVTGKSTSKEILDLQLIKEEFFNKFKTYLDDLDITNMNIIDIISYGVEVESLKCGWFDINKNLYSEQNESHTNIITTSEFPYGHSLNCGRSIFYYSNYIFNHMYNLLGVQDLKFYFTTELNNNEDYDIEMKSNSKIDNEKIKSLILDVFNFDLKEFNDRLLNYDLTEDSLNQTKDKKPYMVQDMLEHVILL